LLYFYRSKNNAIEKHQHTQQQWNTVLVDSTLKISQGMCINDLVSNAIHLFIFNNRNENLSDKGYYHPNATKTGTTIVGVIYKDGVVLGADTRATNGPVVADKNCAKIHFIAPNIYCCGAGTAADTENSTLLISSKLNLHRYSTQRESKVVTAMTMLKRMLFKYQGHVSAALVLGGVDSTGPHLYTIYPHGSTDKLPFVTMGSGSLAAMSVFEAQYKDDMSEEEAKSLVHAAISAGIYNDLGSGSNCDLCVIRKGSVNYIRGYDVPSEKLFKIQYQIPRGTTAVLDTKIVDLKKHVEVTEGDDAMEEM
jgi:20S proteasome subunit beta 2